MSTTQIHESGPPRQAADAREADQKQLIKTIKALIAKGDKAREKSDQFYIALLVSTLRRSRQNTPAPGLNGKGCSRTSSVWALAAPPN